MAVRYAAGVSEDPEIVGVIAVSTPYSVSETTRRRWEKFGSEPSYDEVYERAKRIFKPAQGKEPAKDEIILVEKAQGRTRLPRDSEVYTLKTWWPLAGPEAEGTDTYKHIGNIKVPILLVHGLQDEFIGPEGSGALQQIAKDTGNGDVTQIFMDTGHKMQDKQGELGDIMVKWLDERFAK